ncbi:MAG: hydroxymethylglutaryl-CoA lyase [Chloroflexota bacterium]|nr:hydroxymethylglutaryl-CoA lyase [Chloroflexota bacterium]
MTRTCSVQGSVPAAVTIVEVSPRDGLQVEERVLRTDAKLELLERLADCGHQVIEATSFVRAVPQLADADELMRRLRRREGVRYPVLVPNERGLERALAVGVREIAVFASASETYSRKNLGRGRDEAIDGYREVIRTAKAAGLRVRGYVSMAIADPWEGPTPVASAVDAGMRLFAFGADEVCLGDTIGVGTQREVRALLRGYLDRGVLPSVLAVHFHDTYGQGLANVLSALELGVTTIDASAGGIGGSPFARTAAGNLATEDLLWSLDGSGIRTGVDVQKVADVSVWLGEQLGHAPAGRVARALGDARRRSAAARL